MPRYRLTSVTTPDYARLLPGHDPNAALLPRLQQVGQLLNTIPWFKETADEEEGGTAGSGQDAPDSEALAGKASSDMKGYRPAPSQDMKGYRPSPDKPMDRGGNDEADVEFMKGFDASNATPDEVKQAQRIVGTDDDGIWGRKSWAAFQDWIQTHPIHGNDVEPMTPEEDWRWTI